MQAPWQTTFAFAGTAHIFAVKFPVWRVKILGILILLGGWQKNAEWWGRRLHASCNSATIRTVVELKLCVYRNASKADFQRKIFENGCWPVEWERRSFIWNKWQLVSLVWLTSLSHHHLANFTISTTKINYTGGCPHFITTLLMYFEYAVFYKTSMQSKNPNWIPLS